MIDQQIIGQVLDGRYELISCLGSGGMGVVYKARQRQLDRVVAIKMPHLSNISSPSARNRFEREAQTMAKFSHENIVQVYDYNAKCERPYIVLEYVQGLELADLLAQSDQISVAGVMHVCKQIANGLDYAHRHGVIHRDVKPENIVISDKRRCVKIMDFGLVRIEGENSQDTRAGFVVGTPQYMSPEQVRARPVGPASDVYSFAVIVYCILTGRLPFEGDGMALMMRHASENPPDPLVINPFLPEAVRPVLLRSLAKDPMTRHMTATSMVDELTRALEPRLRLPYAALLRGDPSAEAAPRMSELILAGIGDFPQLEAPRPSGGGEAGQVVLALPESKMKILSDQMALAGLKVHPARKSITALEMVLRLKPDCVIVAEDMPDMRGSALCRLLKASPMGDALNIVFLGDRSLLRMDYLNARNPVQVLSSDEPHESVMSFTGMLLKHVLEARQKQQFDKTIDQPPPTTDNGLAITPLLQRLDEALVQEHASSSLMWGSLRADSLHQTFQQIGDLLRPMMPYRFLFCAICPRTAQEEGALLIDQSDPNQATQAMSLVARLEQEVRRTGRKHKDLPQRFRVRFSREHPPTATPIPADDLGFSAQYLAFAIEEAPRLFGVFGVAYDGDPPSDDLRRFIELLAPRAFHSLHAVYQQQLVATIRDRDDVSGVWRRKHVLEYLRLSLKNSATIEEPFCLMMVDIDGLDKFNDSLGLDGGDRVLREVGGLLGRFGPSNFRAGRIGSDEFLVVMPGTRMADAMKAARSLQQQISQIHLGGAANDLRITVSIGLSYRAIEEKTADTLVKTALKALEAVKSTGGNGIRAAG